MAFNYTLWSEMCSNLRDQVQALELKTKENNGSEMSTEEAKLMLDHLKGLCDQLNTIETQVSSTIDKDLSYSAENNIQKTLKHITETKNNEVLNVKQNLARIISRKPTPDVNTPEPSLESKLLQSQIKKQKFHIEQIESFEIDDDCCPVEAQVLYEHISELYKSFTSNHAKIEAQVDDAALADQKTIALQIKRKAVHIQVKLKKIMAMEKNELVKKSDFLVRQIQLLEPKSSICADKAEITYDQLASLYDSFLSNQMKIETQLAGDTLEARCKISAQVQQDVIEWLTKLKKIFDPSVALPLNLFRGSTITQDSSERMNTPDDIFSSENSSITIDDNCEHLETSRHIQSDVRSMKDKQKEMQEYLKSMNEALKLLLLEKEKANSSSGNSSQSVGYKNNMNAPSLPGMVTSNGSPATNHDSVPLNSPVSQQMPSNAMQNPESSSSTTQSPEFITIHDSPEDYEKFLNETPEWIQIE